MATIALDYDGTFTVDPPMWLSFVKAAQDRGHQVYLITMRYDIPSEAEVVRSAMQGVIEDAKIIFTGRKAKRKFVNAMEINIGIWIDDHPVWISEDAL